MIDITRCECYWQIGREVGLAASFAAALHRWLHGTCRCSCFVLPWQPRPSARTISIVGICSTATFRGCLPLKIPYTRLRIDPRASTTLTGHSASTVALHGRSSSLVNLRRIYRAQERESYNKRGGTYYRSAVAIEASATRDGHILTSSRFQTCMPYNHSSS